MPSLDREEDGFLVECETMPLCLSKSPSPGASGDFGNESKLSSYGSTATTAPASPALPSARTDVTKDPEQWPLLGAVLPPPGGFIRNGGVPPGLTAADILPLASDPFWCRLRAALFASFWMVMVALLATVVYIVVNDPQPCGVGPPSPVPPQHRTFNVSLPFGAMPVLQAVAASRY